MDIIYNKVELENHRRVDPSGAIIRLNVLNRRQYRVPAPRSLYHIDGHHKLIRQVSNKGGVCVN